MAKPKARKRELFAVESARGIPQVSFMHADHAEDASKYMKRSHVTRYVPESEASGAEGWEGWAMVDDIGAICTVAFSDGALPQAPPGWRIVKVRVVPVEPVRAKARKRGGAK